MRSINDAQFSDFLLRVGKGNEPYVYDDEIKIPQNMIVFTKAILHLWKFLSIVLLQLTKKFL